MFVECFPNHINAREILVLYNKDDVEKTNIGATTKSIVIDVGVLENKTLNITDDTPRNSESKTLFLNFSLEIYLIKL